MNRPQSKCGYCGWLLFGRRLQAHGCFDSYDEAHDLIIVDDNGVITMRTKVTDDNSAAIPKHLSESLRNTGAWTDNDDEQLINIVQVKGGLWDHKLHASQRTKLKKQALWDELSNLMGGEIPTAECKKRWQHLRDCYVKARKRMQSYVPSGSGAVDGHPERSGFRFYEQMRFLEDVTTPETTETSLPNELIDQSSSLAQSPPHAQSSSLTPPQQPLSADDPFNQHLNSATTSGSSAGSSKSRKRKADDNLSELEAEFLKTFKEAQPKRDAVDGFLDQLGDILRRLPYVARRNFQLRILTQAADEEDKLLS